MWLRASPVVLAVPEVEDSLGDGSIAPFCRLLLDNTGELERKESAYVFHEKCSLALE